MIGDLEYVQFNSVNLEDAFFNSLRDDYPGFVNWFIGKQIARQFAYIQRNMQGMIEGFLYFKDDGCLIGDVQPPLSGRKILKIGTFKINPHGTRLGERFIKIVLDHAIMENYDVCYVTILDKHKYLIQMFERYGFVKESIKASDAGREEVYVKRLGRIAEDICHNYPVVKVSGRNKYILSIYPKYHTVMFPDSKLVTERDIVLRDISHTNSIHKIYVCTMRNVEMLKRGDILIIYRTAPEDRSAEYSSVVTSVCVVEEVKHQNEFNNFTAFYDYASRYSVFDKNDLNYWYQKGNCKAIKMLYNIALPKRITRHDLIENIGLRREDYWGFLPIDDVQFDNIMKVGGINGSFVIN